VYFAPSPAGSSRIIAVKGMSSHSFFGVAPSGSTGR